VFGDSSDDESLPSKRQKLSDGEDSDDDVPLSAVTLPSKRQKLSDVLCSGEVYSIPHYVIKFVSDLRLAVVFSSFSSFLHQ
jgi:hypothetical protein